MGDRARRMAMYREADWIWVANQVVVVPLNYGARSGRLVVKPWVEGCRFTRLGWLRLKHVVVKAGTGSR